MKKNMFDSFINKVEIVGNKMPHPFWVFTFFALFILILSFIMSKMNISVEYFAQDGSLKLASVRNLLDKEGIRYIFQKIPTIYSTFAPLSLVMIMMISIGFLEKTGMLHALIKKTLLNVNPSWVIAIIALVGINGNIASDAAPIVIPALAAGIFKSMGKNPWIGIIVGYVSSFGGFSANFFIAGTDVLLSGITESVSGGIDSPYHPLINWYFMIAATVVLTIVTVIVTKLFTEKRLSDYDNQMASTNNNTIEGTVSAEENRGLKYCAIASIIFIALLLLLTLPKGSVFRADDGSILPSSPLMKSIISLLFFFFFTNAIVYGKTSGSVKSLKEIPALMTKGMIDGTSFLVVAFPASIFIHLFNLSNIPVIIGVNLGNFLKFINMSGLPLIIAFILVCAIFNLVMTSGSAKWLILAPIFIPVMSVIGISPAMAQLAYRIGDSSTNIISPVASYIPVIMGYLAMYNDKNKEVGIGTIVSLTLPYSIAYLISLVSLLAFWYFLNIPIGPGTYITL